MLKMLLGDCCREKYGVSGKTINSMFNGPYTVHFWEMITKKKQIQIRYNKIYEKKNN